MEDSELMAIVLAKYYERRSERGPAQWEGGEFGPAIPLSEIHRIAELLAQDGSLERFGRTGTMFKITSRGIRVHRGEEKPSASMAIDQSINIHHSQIGNHNVQVGDIRISIENIAET